MPNTPLSQQRVIGGLFGLEPPLTGKSTPPPFAGTFVNYFLNVRCALLAVCETANPGAAWLPSYLCGAVLDPFRKLGVPVRYYDQHPAAEPIELGWTEHVTRGDLVLTIHYFGFPNRTLPAAQLAQQGAVVVEDASQGLFVKQQYPESHCILYSPRKFLGVPDSGVMVSSRGNDMRSETLQPPPPDWCRNALTMVQMRREFDLVGGENLWFPLFLDVEKTFPLGPYRSSDLAKLILETGTDYQFIQRTRRENYAVLLERLKEFALFPELDAETVPLGFPVCVDARQRDNILEHLYGQRIYPPVHWRIDGVVPEEYEKTHSLSRRILTLICDQRYTISDMLRQTGAFLSALN